MTDERPLFQGGEKIGLMVGQQLGVKYLDQITKYEIRALRGQFVIQHAPRFSFGIGKGMYLSVLEGFEIGTRVTGLDCLHYL